MMTKCDRYWCKLNKTNLIILLCSLPVALLLPIMSFILPILFLYISSDKFFVFYNDCETHDDSMRFILSMPFSRKQIVGTYVKGLLYTSMVYTLIIVLIRAVLYLTKISYVFFWSNNISDWYELVTYIVTLTICLLLINIFQISLVNDYTNTNMTNLVVLFLMAVPIDCRYISVFKIFVNVCFRVCKN